MRWDKVGKKTKGVALTPNLNRFREDAVTFENAYAQASWTLPSFTSFFTGLYEFNHQVTAGAVIDAQRPFLIENFYPHYMTVSINGGTWLSGKIGNSRGFDSCLLGSRTKDPFAARTFFEKAVAFMEQNTVPDLFMFLHTYAIHAPYNPPRPFLLRLKNPVSANTIPMPGHSSTKKTFPPL
ncbi:MAG: sulfatase-like hydrolase/transferase [Candidatus Aminicenantes bacterium]|nr:sulfatase-like hydrolase/transferase [Candidatus Aminicenantes bacterium]